MQADAAATGTIIAINMFIIITMKITTIALAQVITTADTEDITDIPVLSIMDGIPITTRTTTGFTDIE